MRNIFIVSAAALASQAVVVPEAIAAETYFKPIVEARVEGNTNRNMNLSDEDGKNNTGGYIGDLSFIYGIATPRSETEIRPRLKIQEYAGQEGVERTEQFLDFRNRYETLRSKLDTVARYSRRDAYTAELLDADFDDFDPQDPTRPETSFVTQNNRRTSVSFRPDYTYKLSQRNGVTAGVQYEHMDYESQVQGRQVDFDYGLAEIGWAHRLDERTDVAVKPYVSRYEAVDDSSTTDGYGVSLEWEREWSEKLRAGLSVDVERNKSELTRNLVFREETTTEWGALFTLDRAINEANRVQLSAGRIITPSGSGTKATSDEVQVQYDRFFSPRLLATAATRLQRYRSLSLIGQGDDRDYGRASIKLRWAMTPTWFVTGGYEFTYREYKIENDDANNNAVFMTVRYEGLGRQR